MKLAGWWVVLAAIGCHGSGSSVGPDATADSVVIDGSADASGSDAATPWTETHVIPSNGGGRFAPLALSGDGTTLVVGASNESSAAATINGDQNDTSAPFTGAAYVFVRSGTTWIQQAYLKPFNSAPMDYGWNVAISHDGNTVAVGAPFEGSGGSSSGAVYVYHRVAGVWTHQAFLKASNVEASDAFGQALAISADGTTIVVGAQQDDSASSTINSGESDNSSLQAGAAYVFAASGGVWTQQAYLKPSNMRVFALFGSAVDVSGNGNAVVVTAQFETSAATGVGGDQASTAAPQSGAAYLFERSGTTWTQTAYIKASNTLEQTRFGHSVALSPDASTIVVGASQENGSSAGINGDQTVQTTPYAGAAYVFAKSGGVWAQQAYLKASNPGQGDRFAEAVAISGTGDRIIVGSGGEDSDAVGLAGDQQNNAAMDSGAAYVFQRNGTSWSQLLYVKATNTVAQGALGSAFGRSNVAMTADGAIFAAGSSGDGAGRGGVFVVQ